MSSPRIRLLSALAAATITATTVAVGVLAAPAGADAPDLAQRTRAMMGVTVAGGGAYGTAIKSNTVVGSGRTAFTTQCTESFGGNATRNYVAASESTLADVLAVSGVETTMRAFKTDANQKGSSATASIARADIGDGAVVLKAINSVAEVIEANRLGTTGPEVFTVNHSVTIGALSIAGQNIPLDEQVPSRKIEVPEVATVWLNRQFSKTPTAEDAQAQTIAVVIRLADGTRVEIGRARATLGRFASGAFNGGAWGTDLSVLGQVKSGKTAAQPLPCRGTSGVEKSNDTAAVTVPGLGTIGATVSTARTDRFADGARIATTTNKIAGLNFGDGALTLDAIEVSAAVLRKPGGKIERQPSVRILGLNIAGEPADLPLPGESIEIPGLGFLTLGAITEKAGSLKVVGLKVVLLQADGVEPIEINLGNAVTRVRS